MSWSLSAIGKPKAVLESIAGTIHNHSVMAEPEETLYQQVGALILATVASLPENTPVKVEASGYQHSTYVAAANAYSANPTNTVKLTIEPIFGFLE